MLLNNPTAQLKRFSLTVLEFFLPRLCLFCGAAVGEDAAVAVCPECEAGIEWVASPLCPCCGLIFPSREGADRVCGSCTTDPPPFARARAAAVYDGPAAEAVKRFKFNRRLVYLPVMQAWLLAQGFKDRPLGREVIIRERFTKPQVGLNPKERRDNVKGAFAVPQPEAVKGKKILLIDDLFTTGATARECARVLSRAGAARVEVLSVARVKHE